MTWRRIPSSRVHLAFRIASVGALMAAFGQVALGGVVRVTGSGLGCPDWPLCHGRIVPPFDVTTLIEYSHRLSASVLIVAVLTVALMAWVFYRGNPWILVSSLLGVALVVMAAVLGGITVMTDLAWWVVLFHLGIAESVVACAAIVSAVGWKATGQVQLNPPIETEREKDFFNMLVLATLVGVFALILSGSYMVGYGAGSSCATWPLCRGSLVPDGFAYAIHMGHRFVAAGVGLLVAVTTASAWSRKARRPELGWVGLVLAILFGVQVMAGAGTVWSGFSAQMKAVHLSLATLVWIAVVLLAALVYSPQRFELKRAGADARQVSPLEGSTL